MSIPSGRILGIDYGTVRVGVAVSDPLNTIARPIGAFLNNASIFPTLAGIVKEYAVGLIVVGMPFTLRGENSQKGLEVEEFIRGLGSAVHVDIKTIDERFTSKMAEQTMLMMGTTRKQRREKGRIDEMAAALILQNYLDGGR